MGNKLKVLVFDRLLVEGVPAFFKTALFFVATVGRTASEKTEMSDFFRTFEAQVEAFDSPEDFARLFSGMYICRELLEKARKVVTRKLMHSTCKFLRKGKRPKDGRRFESASCLLVRSRPAQEGGAGFVAKTADLSEQVRADYFSPGHLEGSQNDSQISKGSQSVKTACYCHKGLSY